MKSAADAIAVLNRLLRTLFRSLPMYLADAQPFTPREQIALRDAIQRLAADRQAYADRLGQAVLDLGGIPDFGAFPGWYTGIHDVAVDYLASRIDEQMADEVAVVEQCIAALPEGSAERDLAREILGNTRSHREALTGLRQKPDCAEAAPANS